MRLKTQPSSRLECAALPPTHGSCSALAVKWTDAQFVIQRTARGAGAPSSRSAAVHPGRHLRRSCWCWMRAAASRPLMDA